MKKSRIGNFINWGKIFSRVTKVDPSKVCKRDIFYMEITNLNIERCAFFQERKRKTSSIFPISRLLLENFVNFKS